MISKVNNVRMTDVVLCCFASAGFDRSLMMAEGCGKLGSVGFGRWIKE